MSTPMRTAAAAKDHLESVFAGRIASGGELRAVVAQKWSGIRGLRADIVQCGDELVCFQVSCACDDGMDACDDGMDAAAKAVSAAGATALLFELLETFIPQIDDDNDDECMLVSIPLGISKPRVSEFFFLPR